MNKVLTSRGQANPFALASYDYALPSDRIALQPSVHRDRSKLMVLHRKTGRMLHRSFYQAENYFSPGDVLVVNDSRVMPSRIFGRKPTGGKVELLLLQEVAPGRWNGLVRNVGWDEECTIDIAMGPRADESSLKAKVHAGGQAGVRMITFDRPDIAEIMDTIGTIPLPPYIKKDPEASDRQRYQTMYADRQGSAAAPTAGMHFTIELLDRLRDKGVQIIPITLHVGYGTFQLIEASDIRGHKIHSEYYRISRLAARRINEARERGGKIFAVGTTVVRSLENACDAHGTISAGIGWNNLTIGPGHDFKATDHLITNFHLPKSSLLVLVASFVGLDRLMRAYRKAMEEGYRFYSYGDAMLIL